MRVLGCEASAELQSLGSCLPFEKCNLGTVGLNPWVGSWCRFRPSGNLHRAKPCGLTPGLKSWDLVP